MRTALVILAAGVGSRFGGTKQLTPVGPGGELIIDYSIYDALEAGFNEIVFIIRRDLETDFREMIGNRLERLCGHFRGLQRVVYVFQEKEDVPPEFAAKVPLRQRPWGTGQAIRACRDAVDCPFVVINADDYYGKSAFFQLHDFLLAHRRDQGRYCMAGFTLKHTLSENGAVTRGLCRIDDKGYVQEVVETRNILKTADGAEADGRRLDPETPVSMNFWGFTPDFLDYLEEAFRRFLRQPDAVEREFLLPELVGELLSAGKIQVKCLKTDENWFGVTYQADRASVQEQFRRLTESGIYPSRLFSEEREG